MEDNWANQTVKTKKASILPILSCNICKNLLDDATAIDECLHLFCRKCIYDKISEEDIGHCPVCNVYLGTEPLNKLREDRAINSLRNKFFPPMESQVKAHNDEVASSKAIETDKSPSPLNFDTINTPKEDARNDADPKEQDISKKPVENSAQSIIHHEGTKNDAKSQEVNPLLNEEHLHDAVKDATDVQNLKKWKKKKMKRRATADKYEEKKISNTTNVQEYDDDEFGRMKIKDFIAEVKLRRKNKLGKSNSAKDDEKIRSNVKGSNTKDGEISTVIQESNVDAELGFMIIKDIVSEAKKLKLKEKMNIANVTEDVQNIIRTNLKGSNNLEAESNIISQVKRSEEKKEKGESQVTESTNEVMKQSQGAKIDEKGKRCSFAPTSKKIYNNKGKNNNHLKCPQNNPDEETKLGKGR